MIKKKTKFHQQYVNLVLKSIQNADVLKKQFGVKGDKTKLELIRQSIIRSLYCYFDCCVDYFLTGEQIWLIKSDIDAEVRFLELSMNENEFIYVVIEIQDMINYWMKVALESEEFESLQNLEKVYY